MPPVTSSSIPINWENKENNYLQPLQKPLQNKNFRANKENNVNTLPLIERRVTPLKPRRSQDTGVKVSARLRDMHLRPSKDQQNWQVPEPIQGVKRENQIVDASVPRTHFENKTKTTTESLDRSLAGLGLEVIFMNLKAKELLRIATVSKAFYTAIKDPLVVAAIINRNCVFLDPKSLPELVNICGQYIANLNLANLFLSQKSMLHPQMALNATDFPALLKKCSNLEKVDLSGFDLEDDAFNSLRKIGTSLESKLKYVRLSESVYIKNTPSNKCDYNWPTLTEIVYEQALNRNNHLFIKWASNCVNLTTLRFPNSNFDDATIEAIAAQFPNLHVLEVTGGIFNYGIIKIAEKCQKLKTLILNTNYITLDCFQVFSEKSITLTSLVELDIFSSKNFLIEDVIDCVSKMTSLQKLNINTIFNYDVDLEKSEKIQSSLTHLGLLNSFFSISFEEVLARAFPNILSLDLSKGISLGSPSVNAIPQKWPKLHTLDLKDNTDFFKDILTTYPALTSLNIDRCTNLSTLFFSSMPNVFPKLRALSMQRSPDNNCVVGNRPSWAIYPLVDQCKLINIMPHLISCIPSSHESEQLLIKREKSPESEFEYSFRYGKNGFQPKFWTTPK